MTLPAALALDDGDIASFLASTTPLAAASAEPIDELSDDAAPGISAPVGVSPEALALTRQLAARHLEVIGQAAADAVEGRRTKRDTRADKALAQALRLATEMQDAALANQIERLKQLFDRAATCDAMDHAIVARRLRDAVLALGALAGGAAEAQLRAVCLRRRGLHPLAAKLRGLKGIGDRRLAKLWDAGLLSTDSLVDADPAELVSAAGIDRALAARVIRMASAHAQERARGAAELLEQAAAEAAEVALGRALDEASRAALTGAAETVRRELERITPERANAPHAVMWPIAWLGTDGEADVLKAWQRGPCGIERVVALKRMRAVHGRDETRRARLEAEARVLARISHPNVVSLLDVIEHGGSPQLVLELLPGSDLFGLLDACTKAKRRMPPALAVTIGVRVARALGAVHALVIDGEPLAHGDVSHRSVMITNDGRVKLIGFGVAAFQALGVKAPSARGHAGALVPEALERGGVLGPAGDQFALAVVIWEAMTLRRLFVGETPAATVANVKTLDVAGRFARHAFVPDGLQAVLAQALERDPARRHDGVAAFAAALERWLVEYGLALSDEALGAFVRALVPVPREVAIEVREG